MQVKPGQIDIAALVQNMEHKKLIEKNIQMVQLTCHGLALQAGWWTDIETGGLVDRNKLELICLMHSELSEACEGVRKDKRDDHIPHRKSEEVELADTIIRILDYAGRYNLDIGGAISDKLAYNATRQDHKIENRKKEGGKKF